jgi:hypothetical protein
VEKDEININNVINSNKLSTVNILIMLQNIYRSRKQKKGKKECFPSGYKYIGLVLFSDMANRARFSVAQ